MTEAADHQREVLVNQVIVSSSPVGSLLPINFSELPFSPERVFIVQDVPPKTTRGTHAHRHCEQYLLLLSGEIHVRMFDGGTETLTILDRPGAGVHLPAMVWGSQTYVHSKSRLLVFASREYDRSDYIEDFEVFLRENRAFPQS